MTRNGRRPGQRVEGLPAVPRQGDGEAIPLQDILQQEGLGRAVFHHQDEGRRGIHRERGAGWSAAAMVAAMRSGERMWAAAPRRMASPGMPKMTEVSAFWAKVTAPRSRIHRQLLRAIAAHAGKDDADGAGAVDIRHGLEERGNGRAQAALRLLVAEGEEAGGFDDEMMMIRREIDVARAGRRAMGGELHRQAGGLGQPLRPGRR